MTRWRVWTGVAVVLAGVTLLGPAPVAAAPRPAAAFIVSVAYAEHRLWVLGEDGKLVSIDLDGGERRIEMAAGVVAIAKWRGEVWVLRRQGAANTRAAVRYEVLVRRRGRFAALTPLTAPGNAGPIGLAPSPGGPILTGQLSIWTLPEGAARWRQIRLRALTNRLPFGSATTAASLDGRSLFVGWNRGEWGGSLTRIDVASGRQTSREREPVTGLAPDPDNPACVLASFGLNHMIALGRVGRACGDELKTVLEIKPAKGPGIPPTMEESEPFFGLAADSNGVWAVSYRALYRLNGAASPMRYPIGDWTEVGGVQISRPADGAILVLTGVNAHKSLSGDTPLVVPAP